jgi:hypothetical protein
MDLGDSLQAADVIIGALNIAWDIPDLVCRNRYAATYTSVL